MSEALKQVRAFRESMIKDFLDECTQEQIMMFKRMYSHKDLDAPLDKVLKNMPDEKLDQAVRQCETTVLKNRAKQPALQSAK